MLLEEQIDKVKDLIAFKQKVSYWDGIQKENY